MGEVWAGGRFRLNTWGRGIKCPYEDCGSIYNLHMSVPKGGKVICPTCLRDMVFDIDWLVPPTVAYVSTGLYIPQPM